MVLEQSYARRIICPGCRSVFHAAGVPAGRTIRCHGCDPRPEATLVRSGIKIGYVAAALCLAAVIVAGSIFVVTRSRHQQVDAPSGQEVAQQTDSLPDADAKNNSPPKDDGKKASSEAAQALARGNTALEKKEFDQAISEYSEAIRLQPGWAWAYCKRGQAYMNKKEYARAIADCDEALKLDAKLIDALAFRAASQFDGGDFDAAIATADRALKLDDKDVFFYFIRGTSSLQKGALDRAIADLSEAIRLDAKNPQYLNNRGVAYERRGDTAKANADYARRDALPRQASGRQKTVG